MPVETETQQTEVVEPEAKRLCTMPGESVVLRFAKLTAKALTPTRGSKLAAGYDLYSDQVAIIKFSSKKNEDISICSNEGALSRKLFRVQQGDVTYFFSQAISAYDTVVPGKGKAVVKTDIQIALPDGCYGRVAPRSGLAAKHFIDVGAGVIDQDYRGNVGVVMFNFSETDFEVKAGDRIAQLICERIYLPELKEEQTLDDTDRGSGGFGSTGKN